MNSQKRICQFDMKIISLALDNELSPEQDKILTEHLRVCISCRELKQQLMKQDSLLTTLKRVKPGPAFESAVWNKIEQTMTSVPTQISQEQITGWQQYIFSPVRLLRSFSVLVFVLSIIFLAISAKLVPYDSAVWMNPSKLDVIRTPIVYLTNTKEEPLVSIYNVIIKRL